MKYDNSIAVEWNNKRINELIETTESNQRRINELTEKINKQDEVNKHINDKFRKIWDCFNADHLRLEAVEEIITGINDKLDCVNDKTDFCVIKINDKIDDRLDKLEAQERAMTKVINMNAGDISDLEDEKEMLFTKYKYLKSQLTKESK